MDIKKRTDIIKDHMNNREFDDAESLINQLIEELKPQNEDDETIYYSFDNVVQDILNFYYTRPKKKTELADAPYSVLYYYLLYIYVERKDFEKALQYADLATRWNPADLYTMFEKAGIYGNLYNLDLYRIQVESTYRYIYNKVSLAKYYGMLGYYYIERKCYDIANALYTYSVVLNKTEGAINELKFIAKQENREFFYTPQNDAAELFKLYKIPFGFSGDTVGILKNEYARILQNPNSSDYVRNNVRAALYEMTSDPKYAAESEVAQNGHVQNMQTQGTNAQVQNTNASNMQAQNTNASNLQTQRTNASVEMSNMQNQTNGNLANSNQPNAEVNSGNFIEYKMISENYPTFVFKIPHELGEVVQIGQKVFEIKKDEKQVARITMWRCGKIDKFSANVKAWIDKNMEANKMEIVSHRQEFIKGFLIENYSLKYLEKPNAPERIYKTIFIKDCAIAVASSMNNKEEIVNQILDRIECE